VKDAIKKGLAKAIMCQLENSPSTEDLVMQTEVYTEMLQIKGLTDPGKITRRFTLWCTGESRFPTPADIVNMRISDYVPTSNTGQAQIGNDSRKLPLRSETITAGEFAAEHLKKMRESLK